MMKRIAFFALLAGCALGPGAQDPTVLRVTASATNDPTVRGARLAPAEPDLDHDFGVEPGGGVRTITDGIRVVNGARGAVLSAVERLPQAPTEVVPIPARMGGGFFYLIGNTVWRSSGWLSKAEPVFQGPQTIKSSFVGLDRVYFRLQSGANIALDPKSGRPIDTGPLPGTPSLTAFIPVDGWHAVAIADLRGVVSTDDAGVTWRSVKVPIDPRELRKSGDVVLVGNGNPRAPQWYEVQRGGFVAKATTPTTDDERAEDVDPIQRVYGKRPLLAAIEDGWPLSDGTAVVARDGELARVRLSDGAVLDHAPGAFAEKPARCHPIVMSVPSGFGFVCGEPRGRTAIYAFEGGKLAGLKSFASPRRVLASGTGAVVVRGGCDAEAPEDDARSAEQLLCVRARGATEWREVRIKDASCLRIAADKSCEEYARDQRVVMLASGALIVLSPPRGSSTFAQLTILEPSGGVRTVPVTVDATNDTTPTVHRALRTGMWLDGFEERSPNTIGGWVELAGVLVGVNIRLDGHLRHGLHLHDGGRTMLASGRWGLAFARGRGYETLDGGMTWVPVDLPEPLARKNANPVRTCGPIGCAAEGWLRIGWGAPLPMPDVTPSAPSLPPQPSTRAPSLDLVCEQLKQGPPGSSSPILPVYPSYGYYGYQPRPRNTIGWSGDFLSVTPPKIDLTKELGFASDAREISGVTASSGARFYAWASKEGEWDKHNRWIVRWLWPFGTTSEVRSSSISATPRAVMETSGWLPTVTMQTRSFQWSMFPGEDAQHALMFGRQTSGASEYALYELEEARTPTEVRRADGEPIGELDSAARVSGRWYIATRERPGRDPATLLWEIDGGVARELARLPRTSEQAAHVRLARRADGRSIGVMVEGQPSASRWATAVRWVAPVDLESGAVSEPEALGPIDFGDRPITVCRGDEPGWVIDLPWTAPVSLGSTSGAKSSARGTMLARVRAGTSTLCLERLSANAGELDLKGSKVPVDAPSTEVSLLAGSARHLLRCVAR